jgi:hypothetical protein
VVQQLHLGWCSSHSCAAAVLQWLLLGCMCCCIQSHQQQQLLLLSPAHPHLPRVLHQPHLHSSWHHCRAYLLLLLLLPQQRW